jgi:hypothetical protein
MKSLRESLEFKMAKNAMSIVMSESDPMYYSTYIFATTPLVNLVCELAETLKEISTDFGTDYCDGNCLKAKEALDIIEKFAEEK